MNLIIVVLVSVKRLSKALRFCRSIFYPQWAHMHIASITGVGKLLLIIFYVIVSVLVNEVLVNC